MIQLRDYQNELVTAIRLSLRTNRCACAVAPTGAGKTVIASYLADSVVAKGGVLFFICHRKELIEQTAKTFDDFGVTYGFIAAGFPTNYYEKVQICSIDTLKNRIEKLPMKPTVVLWDETHHVGAAGWLKTFNYYDQAYHIGLTATPERLDGKGLDLAYTDLVEGPTTAKLIASGYLNQYRLFSVAGIDMGGVPKQMGDFAKSKSAEAMSKPSITGDIISHWKAHASTRKTIGFAPTVKYSQYLVEQFNNNGVAAAHLDGSTDKKTRKEVLRALATGKLSIVFNIGLFSEGFDIAANSGLDVTVGAVIDAAPTQSLSQWLQRCGRALRPADEPAIILDHAGNAMRHGLPCDNRAWQLAGKEARIAATKSANTDPVRQCPKCFYAHRPEPVCPNCGYEYQNERKIVENDGELIEVKAGIKREQRVARTKEELSKYAKKQNYNPKWADHIAKAREEKNILRKKLFNLTVAAKAVGINTIRPSEINNMKPKELKEHIDLLDKAIGG